MDWARAKNILIVAFIILNIFLLTTILYTNYNLRFQSDYTRYALNYLKSRNVKIECDIPDIGNKAGIIGYDIIEPDLGKLIKLVFGNKAEKTVENNSIIYEQGKKKIIFQEGMLTIIDTPDNYKSLITDSEKFNKKIYGYLKTVGIGQKELSIHREYAPDGKREAAFFIKYKGALLFDKTVTAEINENGLMTVSLPVMQIKETNIPEEIISIYQIIVMSNLEQGSVLKSVDFGYKQINSDDVFDTPVWRIATDNNTPIFFNAYTGEEL
jgi:hypothetical protein